MSNQAIGIFDSGIGGLTVARAIKQVCPNEKIIYFGDTAHLPYGDKSQAAIQAYSVKICDLLLKRGCKMIVIACNSASAAAYELVKEYVGSKAKVVNVIDPVVKYLEEKYQGKKIGLIGTKQTITSNSYQKKVDQLNKEIELSSLATPLLCPMIEEGFFRNEISHQVIHQYLSNDVLSNIESLILGCTHYPLIKDEIQEYYESGVEVIDSSLIVANFIKSELIELELLNEEKMNGIECYVSDYTKSFEASTELFFSEKIQLEHYPLWE